MYTDTRTFGPFKGILLKSIGNVEIIQSDEHKVIISSNKNIAPDIKTEVINNNLVISFKESLPVWMVSFPKIDIQVYMKKIENLKVSSVGKLKNNEPMNAETIKIYNSGVGGIFLNLKAEKVFTYLKGVGEIELHGEAGAHELEISGTGKIDAYNFMADYVKIVATGIGECVVYAVEKLEYKAGGIGRIKYRGNPEVSGQQSGLGGIQKIQ